MSEIRYQDIWDVLHDALMLPRCAVSRRRHELGPLMIGQTITDGRDVMVCSDQLHVTWATGDLYEAHVEALADRIAAYEPDAFGPLPLMNGRGWGDMVNLSSRHSPIVARLIAGNSGLGIFSDFEPYTPIFRFDVLVAKSVKKQRAA